MPNQRDWEQMLQCGLEMKAKAQKVIDFAKMYGAGSGGEGEEDLEEIDEDKKEAEDSAQDDGKPGALNRNPKAALVMAAKLRKKGSSY